MSVYPVLSRLGTQRSPSTKRPYRGSSQANLSKNPHIPTYRCRHSFNRTAK